MSLKAARAARLEKAFEVAAGKSPAQMKRLARAGLTANPTLRQFGERYYTEQVLRRWKDPSQIRRYLDNELYPNLGGRQLKEITALDVQTLVYRKRDNGHVAAAVQLRSVIKQMYDYAVVVGLVTVNPAAMVATRFIGKARKRSRVLSPKEIRLYLTTIYRSNIRRQFKLALHLLLLTMVRKGELLFARCDAKRAKRHFSDLQILVFITSGKVTNYTGKKWQTEIKKEYGWDLVVMPREEIIATLQMPKNVGLCAEHLGIVVPPTEPTVEALIQNALAANGEIIANWSRRLGDNPVIDLRLLRLDDKGPETQEMQQRARPCPKTAIF